MLWETIKKVLQKQNGVCIIIEDGKPVYVVSSFAEYQKMLEEKESVAPRVKISGSDQELLEKINQEISSWKAAQSESQIAEALEQEAEDEVRIEDLPL